MHSSNTPSCASTLDSIIKSKEPERNELAYQTEQFLKKGGKITVVSDRVATGSQPLSTYNQRSAKEGKKRRDALVDSIVEALTAGTLAREVYKSLNISHPTFMRIIKENNLEDLLNQ